MKGQLFREIKRDYLLYIMLIVPLVMCILFSYLPMYGLIIAFKKYDLVTGLKGTDWVGFKYFIQFFNDPYCFRLIRNTLLLGFFNLLCLFPMPIIFALLLNEVRNSHFKKIVQSVSYFPYFVSVVIVIGLLFEFVSNEGFINKLLVSVTGNSINFLGNSSWFRPLYIFTELWQKTGYASIVYLAALTGISNELYEAAYIDGANRWKQTLHVTLPGLLPTMIVILILNVGKQINISFEKVLLMYNPAIYETADVLSTYIYRRGIQGMDFSYSAAIGLFNSLVALLLVVVANYLSKRASSESIW